jgi:hypothetical protein
MNQAPTQHSTTPEGEPDLETALAAARDAVRAAPDSAAALRRLSRHIRRERDFAASPAAVPHDDLVAARTAGVPAHLAAALRPLGAADDDPLPTWMR